MKIKRFQSADKSSHTKDIRRRPLGSESGEGRKQDMMGDYPDLLGMLVSAISISNKDDESSNTSTTLPETVYTNEDDISPFFLCGGSLWRQNNDTERKPTSHYGLADYNSEVHWERRQESEEQSEDDDDLSISSDVVPLMMMDDDALDEISFTRELMGYEEGFDAHDMPIGRILENQDEEISNEEDLASPCMNDSPRRNPHKLPKRQNRPPLPTNRSLHQVITIKNYGNPSTREGPANSCGASKSSSSTHSRTKKGHRRRWSDGSNESTEETLWWQFHLRSRSTDGSMCSQQSQGKHCRKKYRDGKC